MLGPICLNYFMYDIPTHSECKNLQFADDTTTYIVHDSPGTAQNSLNVHLVGLQRFFVDSKLLLNAEKSESMHCLGFQRDTNAALRRATRNARISVCGRVLPVCDDVRLLGVRFQTNARFTRHVDQRLKKARFARFHVGRLLSNRHIDTRIKSMIYKLYIRPVLTFASPVWCRPPGVSSHQMERMRVYKRSCLRSAANIRRPRGKFKHVQIGRIYALAK